MKYTYSEMGVDSNHQFTFTDPLEVGDSLERWKINEIPTEYFIFACHKKRGRRIII